MMANSSSNIGADHKASQMLTPATSSKMDAADQKPTEIMTPGGSASHIAFTSDGRRIITVRGDKNIYVWDCAGNQKKQISLPYLGFMKSNSVRGIAVHGDSIFIANTNRIQKASLSKGLVENLVIDKNLKAKRIIVSSNGAYLAFDDGIYDLKKSCLVWFEKPNYENISDESREIICFNFDNTLVAINYSYISYFVMPGTFPTHATISEIIFYDCGTGKKIKKAGISYDGRVERTSSSFLKDRYMIGTFWRIWDSKVIAMWDIETRKMLKKFSGHTYHISALSTTHDGRFIVSGGVDKTIQIWDIETGELLNTLPHSEAIYAIAISPDDKCLAYSIGNGKLVIRDLPSLILPHKEKENSSPSNNSKSLVKIFLQELEQAEKGISINLLKEMFEAIDTLIMFKLPYTLACLEIRYRPEHKEVLSKYVFECLEKLRIIKNNHPDGSQYVLQYEDALSSAVKKGFITESQERYLKTEVLVNRVLSDSRFVNLEKSVECLQQELKRIDINVSELSLHVNALKHALANQVQRNVLFSIVKMGLGFIISPAVDFIKSVFDLSDMVELGASIMHVSIEECRNRIKEGSDKLKEYLGKNLAGSSLNLAGCHPEEFLTVWTQAMVKLQLPLSPSELNFSAGDAKESKRDSLPVTVVSNEPSSATLFKRKLNMLMSDNVNGYAFLIKRQRKDCLIIQLEDAKKESIPIKDVNNLLDLADSLQQRVIESAIEPNQYKFEFNWKHWMISISASNAILNQINKLLLEAGAKDFTLSQARAVRLFETTSESQNERTNDVLSISCSIQ